MKYIKSERLKKLEIELSDLEQWLRLGLVPKKDIEKHEKDIQVITLKIANEKEKLKSSKENESGEENYIAPKQSNKRKIYDDTSIAGIEIEESVVDMYSSEFDFETEENKIENSVFKEIDNECSSSTKSDDGELYFSEKSRWRRLTSIDSNADHW